MVPGEFDLPGRIVGEYIYRDDPKYPEVRDAQLKAFHHHTPRGVVRAFTAEDVAETITAIKRTGIELRPRSGGHCFAGRSSTDGIVLDVSPMWGFTVEGDTATLGAGGTLRTIHRALWQKGRTLNLGCGPTVGIAGLTLGGGIGLLGRAYGLTSDRLVKATVVLADGSIVQADEDHHGDLFWALRGAGGGQFGVVTEFTFRTLPAPVVTSFQRSFAYEPHQEVIANWTHWAPDSPDRLNAYLRLVATPNLYEPPILFLFGIHFGTAAETERILADAGVSLDWAYERSYQDLKSSFRTVGREDFYEPDAERSRSEFFREPLSTDVVAELLERFARGRTEDSRRELNFTPWGGAYTRVGETDTAFAHRNSRFLLEHFQQTAANVRDTWVDESWQLTHPYSDEGRVYPNFPDPDLDDPLTAYHGANLERLQAIKQRYDPDRFFDFPQAL